MSEDQTHTVTVAQEGHLLLIGLNRPEKRNAATAEMLGALALAYGQLDRDPELRVGVVFAHGDHFSAGLDLLDVGPRLQAGGSLPVPEGGLDPWGVTTAPVRKPVVMAIQGICYTLGVELALASDVVIARDNASFAQLEVARGILPFGGATTRMPRSAGWSRAMRWLLSAEPFDAHTAREMGIVTEIVEGDPFELARDIASRIAAQAPLAVQETLASARAGREGMSAEHEVLGERLATLMATKDVGRGLEAFVTKTPARFEGD